MRAADRLTAGRVWGAKKVGLGGGREWESTVLAREVATAIVADRTTHEPSQRALAAKRLEALGGDPVGGRRARGLVVGRAECLLAGVLAVAFWDGGGPAGQKPERVLDGEPGSAV
jgi:hypothetical protein